MTVPAALHAPVVGARERPGLSTRMRSSSWVGLAGVPIIVAVVTFALCLTVGVLRYLTYHAWAYDLGYFTQVVDQTAAGHPFQTTFAPYSFLGQHWEPVLLVPAALMRIVATPLWLIGLQAAALALAPVAAWRLARAWVGGRLAPTAACFATALSPLLASAATFDVHTEAMTPAIALFALDASARDRGRRFLLLMALLFLVKEDAMLVASGVGWIAWRADGRRAGLAVAAAGVAAFAVTVGVVMPALRGGGPTDLAARYAYLGATPGSAALGLFTHPGAAIGHLVGADARLGWLRAFGPLAFLPLLSGVALLGVLPVLGVALLSDAQPQSTLDLQYGLQAFPLLVACALLGVRRVSRLAQREGSGAWARRITAALSPRRLITAAAVPLVAASVLTYAVDARLPGGGAFDGASVRGLERHSAVEAVLERIPPDASVAASSGLVAHLADRAEVYQYPDAPQTQYVAIDGETGLGASGNGEAVGERLAAAGYHLVASGGEVRLWAH